MKSNIYKWTCPKCKRPHTIELGAGLNQKIEIPLKDKIDVRCMDCEIKETLIIKSKDYDVKDYTKELI